MSHQQTLTLFQILHSNPCRVCTHFSNPQLDLKKSSVKRKLRGYTMLLKVTEQSYASNA